MEYLFRKISSRHNLLSQSNPIILQEDNLQLVTDHGVVVDDFSDHVEQLDGLLGHVVAWGGFATDHHGTWHKWGAGVGFDPKRK